MKSQQNKKDKWLERVQGMRRYYAFQRWADHPKEKRVGGVQFIKWLAADVVYLAKWNLNLFLQLRAFGTAVKNYSGLSFYQQWKRMAYLVFKVRVDSNTLRIYHLFEDDRWKKVHTYSFNRHTMVQNEFLGYPYQEELDCFRDKRKYYEFCKNNSINTAEVYAVIDEGKEVFSNPETGLIPSEDLFVKELKGSGGRGGMRFTFSDGIFKNREGKEFKKGELENYLKDISNEGVPIIIQEVLQNHKEWRKFTNGSLATCRIVTGRSPHNQNEIIPFFAALRMPFGDSEVDNYSTGGIAAEVDIETGIMSKAITPKPIGSVFSFDAHPDTDEQITGEKVYKWDELVEVAKETHKNFKSLSIGWDIALTTQGFYIVEGNSFWMSGSIEGTSGKSFYETSYPEWVEDWIEIRSKDKIESLPNFRR